ncbi:MAG: ATP-dependent Clp protease adapter ClpS [Myxococcales bacterium]
MSSKARTEGETGVVTRTRADKKLKRPPLYKVILHNDDFTPMEFVVLLLRQLFHKTESDATAIMLHAHTQGFAVAGVYAHEIAEEKVDRATALAREAQFPLLCTMEAE